MAFSIQTVLSSNLPPGPTGPSGPTGVGTALSNQLVYSNAGAASGANVLFFPSNSATVFTNTVYSLANIYDTPIVTVTASATYTDNVAGKVLFVNPSPSADVTLTFTAAAASGFAVTIIRGNTGNVTIANTTAIAKVNSANFTTSNIMTRWDSATVLYSATNQFVLFGTIA